MQEQFCYMRDQFLNDGHIEKICPSCNQYGHEVYDCPQIHFCVNRSALSQRVFFSRKQERADRPSNQRQRTRISWQNISRSMRIDLKQIRWTYIIEQLDLNDKVNIMEQVNVQESDKQFFTRCPKLKQGKLLKQRKSFRIVKVANHQTPFQEYEVSVSNSDENDRSSDFQTDYSDSFSNLKDQCGDGFFEQNSPNISILSNSNLNPILPLLNQNESKNYKKLETGISMRIEDENIGNNVPYMQNNVDLNNVDNKSNEEQVSNFPIQFNIKSETNIKNTDTYKKIGSRIFQPIQTSAQQMLSPNNYKTEYLDKDMNLRRKTSKKKSSKFTLKMSDISNPAELTYNKIERKNSLTQNTLVSFQDRVQQVQSPSVQLFNNNTANNFTKSNLHMNLNNLINISSGSAIPYNGGNDNSNVLEQMIEKLYTEYFRIKTKNMKCESPSLCIQKEEAFSPINPRNSQKKLTIQEDQNSHKKKHSETEILQQHSLRPLIKQDTLIHHTNHFFGKLEFGFDQLREYSIYYPKGNASNILKIYKKIQFIRYSDAMIKTIKKKQTFNQEHHTISFLLKNQSQKNQRHQLQNIN